MDVDQERWNLDFSVAKSIRYHAYRRSFWDAIDRASKILTIVSGAAVLVVLIGNETFAAKVLALLVAVASAADVVLGFSQKARVHDGLYRSFSRLAQDLAEREKPTEADIAGWRRRRLEIEMDEPFVLDLLERRCAAEEAQARGRPVNDAWKLTKWQILRSQTGIWPAFHIEEAPDQG